MLVGGFVLSNRLFRPAVLIPVYNHEHAIAATLMDVLEYKLDVLLVDDGSTEQCRHVLASLADKYKDRVSLLILNQNGGKGHAVKSGLNVLETKGYTHALQVDADGQHNLTDIPQFIMEGKKAASALIAGYPVYDSSISKGRLYGRYLTHVWVWINTLSFTIKDSMCGFRLYPILQFNRLLETAPCGNRMDFDPEVIVRWLWVGGAIKHIPTQVNYPSDGVSHFLLYKDNALISWMHTRLFFGMLRRLPTLIRRQLRQTFGGQHGK
ncbi:hypothetical protein GCM10007852_16550 [Agaribacter marinus]|uniref:Glycosyltransferase 2-like domain-containing protein n=1 Tax=Agaribacter marinus TaxID=1431249 RepID=A0AA37SX51_9ALTE|nr:hypothetical protein GCM10007852_16550 [Agaribacter marinus]